VAFLKRKFPLDKGHFISVVLLVVFGITSGGMLFSSFNIQSVIRDSIPVILGGLGVIFVIATGGCDLSIGAVAAVAATVGAYYGSQYGAGLTIVIAILIGLVSGTFLGFIVSRCHVSSFMASLALLMGLRGFLNVCNVTWEQVYLPEGLLFINGFGPALAITIVLIAIIGYVFEKTSFGYYCKGMGENENTIRCIGVNTAKVRHIAFIISGVMAAIMGLLLIAATGGSSSTLGNFMEMKVQMGVFLGGVLVSGGMRSKIYKLIFGSLSITVIVNGLTLSGASSAVTELAEGIILMVILYLTIQLSKHSNLFGFGKKNDEEAEAAAA
jgi:ribose/xylose/arabinose/galactoside ABC-type transport system permease subunit